MKLVPLLGMEKPWNLYKNLPDSNGSRLWRTLVDAPFLYYTCISARI